MKYKFETWHIIVGLILIVLIGQSTGMFSILGTAEGYKSIEPTTIASIEDDMDIEFSERIKDDFLPGYLLLYSTTDLDNIDYREVEPLSMFGVLDLSLARLLDFQDIDQDDINQVNEQATNEFGLDPEFTLADFNNLKRGECKPVIELYVKYIPLIVAASELYEDEFYHNLNHIGLKELIKGRDIYDIDVSIEDGGITHDITGRIWCNADNEMVNFELEVDGDNSPFDDWYFDTYIVEDEDAGFVWSKLYTWAPNIGTLDQKQSAFIIFGVGFLILYLLFKRK